MSPSISAVLSADRSIQTLLPSTSAVFIIIQVYYLYYLYKKIYIFGSRLKYLIKLHALHMYIYLYSTRIGKDRNWFKDFSYKLPSRGRGCPLSYQRGGRTPGFSRGGGHPPIPPISRHCFNPSRCKSFIHKEDVIFLILDNQTKDI